MNSKIDILAFGAHPDDIELSCAGTILKHINIGMSVGAIDLTEGELGTRGTSHIRAKEAEVASQLMGLKFRHNLNIEDGFINSLNKEHQLDIIKFIRHYKPKIVLCNAKQDRHPDHAHASELISKACFLSGLKKLESNFDGKKQDSWRPKQVLHYIQWENIKPDFLIDISGFMEKKLEVVKAYESQFFKSESIEPETPISSQQFINSVQYRAADFGRLLGVDYAEGFTSDKLIGLKHLHDLI
jgi:bacillithiol biosynthesis deacetylase BshB1